LNLMLKSIIHECIIVSGFSSPSIDDSTDFDPWFNSLNSTSTCVFASFVQHLDRLD
jgi:hypothetical protein